MNELAVRLEEQIISLCSNIGTELYQGWVLKQDFNKIVIYPLYRTLSSKQDIVDCIKQCEEISRQKSLNCEFRIVEHTNYYLASILEDNGYKQCGYIIVERCVNERIDIPAHNIGKTKQEEKMIINRTAGVLYLPNGRLSCESEIYDIFQFAVRNQISRILISIPDNEKALDYYRKMGFNKVYRYRCYQKENL
ncbi:MAG: hypothetical protein NC433_14655 [Clostridiales bacterium]|nr:hypothetical protein [Clostridiales bacterium]